MPQHKCPFPNCEYSTDDVTDELASILFKIHAEGAHSSSSQRPAKVENVRRPIITTGGTSEEWSYFLTRWSDYKTATKLSGTDVVIQLLECCEEDLRKDLTRAAGGSLTRQSEDDVLQRMKALAVRQENIMVARVELHDMHQDVDEAVRPFAAHVKGQAGVCRYIMSCPSCNEDVNYTDEIMKDVIIKGISDCEIQLDLLSDHNQSMKLEEILRYVEARESGKRSATKLISNIQHQQAASSSRSSYKKSQSLKQVDESLCNYCGKAGHGKNATMKLRKKLCQAFGKKCSHCGLSNHFASVCRMKGYGLVKSKEHSATVNNDSDTMTECPIWEELCSIRSSRQKLGKSLTLDHHVYTNMTNRWVKQSSKPQPFISVLARTSRDDYNQLGFTLIPNPACVKVSVMPDTGCQSCLAGMSFLRRLGLLQSHLIPVNLKMSAANKSKITILGAAIVRFCGRDKNETHRICKRQKNERILHNSVNHIIFLYKNNSFL